MASESPELPELPELPESPDPTGDRALPAPGPGGGAPCGDPFTHDAGRRLADWFAASARDLPFRKTRDPYAILVSEIMLQQTRVETMLPYYARFLERFPDPFSLAAASEEEVLTLWRGLGYYARGRNLLALARAVCRDHSGRIPDDPAALRALPGIGDYTAGAVLSIAFGRPEPAVDGNVLRVAARLGALEDDILLPSTRRAVTERVRAMTPPDRAAQVCEGLMELGARICLPAAPRCGACPLSACCRAFREGKAEALPVRRRRMPPLVDRLTAFVVEGPEGILLVRRPAGGLLGGMDAVPLRRDVPVRDAPAYMEGLPSGLPDGLLSGAVVRDAGLVRHQFTHRTWEIRVLHVTAGEGPLPPAARLAAALSADDGSDRESDAASDAASENASADGPADSPAARFEPRARLPHRPLPKVVQKILAAADRNEP